MKFKEQPILKVMWPGGKFTADFESRYGVVRAKTFSLAGFMVDIGSAEFPQGECLPVTISLERDGEDLVIRMKGL